MRLKEFIEQLSKLDQDAHVSVYAGYDPEYGEEFNVSPIATQKTIGWDRLTDEPIIEVFIK